MNPAIERFEILRKEKGLPHQLVLTRYRTLEDWLAPEETRRTPEACALAAKWTDELAEHATNLGVKVAAVWFDPARYHAWRGAQPDTRPLRAQWASDPRANVKRELAFVVTNDSVGWVVLGT
jgi:hypothetical protein